MFYYTIIKRERLNPVTFSEICAILLCLLQFGLIKKLLTKTHSHYEVCSKEGPIACGYGWTNPDPNAPVPGFTFHQVSDGSICVNCNIELPGPPPCNNGFCECKDIKTKIDLMDCGKCLNLYGNA